MPMRIADHVYFDWELEVGSQISGDWFAIARTQLGFLYTFVFYGVVKNFD
jgi:hypothetical protein